MLSELICALRMLPVIFVVVALAGALASGRAFADEPAPAAAEGAPFRSELRPAFHQWQERPGEMLSIFDNASDLAASAERTHANATYTVSGLRLVEDADAPYGVAVRPPMEHLKLLAGFLQEHGYYADLALGERNNPYFTHYPEVFREKRPEAYMRDRRGEIISVTVNPIADRDSPVPAVVDPVLTGYSADHVRKVIAELKDNPRIKRWVAGGEEAYPDYYGLPMGDFSPSFLRQFESYVETEGLSVAFDKDAAFAEEPNPVWAAWFRFREQAMADRAAIHAQAFIGADPSRPVLFPTHGSPFAGHQRRGLGLSPSLLVGACDGFEMGHIAIDDDDERLNPLFMTALSSFGRPIIVPRLGDKTLDPEAQGGGRSFTPRMLRRLVYECLGMGAAHIGPIHWQAVLGDGEWFIRDTPAEATCREVFGEIRAAWPYLQGMARMQPRVGLYVSDDTWIRGWDARWTALFHDALERQWTLAVAGDAMLSAELARDIPVLVSMANHTLGADARRGLRAYMEAGGVVLAWGEQGVRDGASRPADPLAEHERLVRVNAPAEPQSRTIINEFQTGDGAWQWPHIINPAPADAIGNAALRHAGEPAVRPVTARPQRADAQVNVFPLTDGASALVVLVNMLDRPETVKVALLRHANSSETWLCRNVTGAERREGKPELEVDLAAYGTALVWFAPLDGEEAIEGRIAQAREALARWREAGADTGPLEPFEHALDHPEGHRELRLKAGCAADRLLASLALSAEASWEAGALVASCRVYPPEGGPLGGARVLADLTPGSGERLPLEPQGGGRYELRLGSEELPRFYDLETGDYRPVSGPVRVTFEAAHGASRGGAFAVAGRE